MKHFLGSYLSILGLLGCVLHYKLNRVSEAIRSNLRAPEFQNFPGGYAPRPPYKNVLHTPGGPTISSTHLTPMYQGIDYMLQ